MHFKAGLPNLILSKGVLCKQEGRRASVCLPVAARKAVLRLDDCLLAEGVLALVDSAARGHCAKVGRPSHGVHGVGGSGRIGTRSADGDRRLGVVP